MLPTTSGEPDRAPCSAPRQPTRNVMSILAWIILGLIAGFIASKLVNRSGEGVVIDVVLGIVGAVVGGYLFNVFGSAGVTGLNLWSMLVAVVGAVVVLVIKHAIMGRR
jgi:uncharacterized membrane protein YeaQ/YmgE (transglycosylase-associated protein family)